MRNATRRRAFLAAALLLVTPVGETVAQEGAQTMGPAEDARLAARAARNPELEKFTAGYIHAIGYAAALAAVAGFSIAVGHLIACPLGYSHSSQGKNFFPAETLKDPSKTVNYFNFCGAVLGFPLYGLGYLIGLPFAPTEAPAKAPPVADEWIERTFLGYTAESPDGHLQLAAASVTAEHAGLLAGDLILEIDNVAITGANLRAVLRRYHLGDAMDVAVLREGCLLRIVVATKR